MMYLRAMPGSIRIIAVSMLLLALSGVLMGLLALIVALAAEGPWHGAPAWFAMIIILVYGLLCLAALLCIIAAPIASALLVNCENTRTKINVTIIAMGWLTAFVAILFLVSKL